jgi:S-(hydroxymethyl)glutathione synthase
MADKISIHPKIDPGIQPAAKDFAGGDLICKCAKDPVRVTVKAQYCLDRGILVDFTFQGCCR